MIRETGERFNCRAMNQRELDIETKRAILKVSPSVVALASHTSGGSELSQGCGTLIAVEGNSCILVTSLNLLRRSNSSISKNIKVTVYTCDGISCVGEILTYDFHYNILFIKFRCDNSTTQSAKLKLLEFENDVFPNTSSRLCPSNRTTFKRDEPVVVVGRYYRSPFEVMTAVGIVSERCPMWHDCTELLVASCAITRCGDGSPLINHSGEVIGIVYYMAASNCEFLPINIVCKWWNHYKEYKVSRHPFYGFEASSVCVADFSTLEILLRSCSSISGGVLVKKVIVNVGLIEKMLKDANYARMLMLVQSSLCLLSNVLPDSCAKTAGLMKKDIITKCDGNNVNNFLELWDMMFEKVGETVELEVIRNDHSFHKFNMAIDEPTLNELNSWPRHPY